MQYKDNYTNNPKKLMTIIRKDDKNPVTPTRNETPPTSDTPNKKISDTAKETLESNKPAPYSILSEISHTFQKFLTHFRNSQPYLHPL